MIERRDGSRLAQKPSAELFVRDFDGDLASQTHIAGAEYLAHAALAQSTNDLVRADLRSRSPAFNRRIAEQTRGHLEDGPPQTSASGILCQQRQHVPEQVRIVPAGGVQKGLLRVRR